ncbi:MAG TPA: tetratricopeptide repeat protein [Kamptonema sp.]|nr:tetratricopeptide repeat protein [Kamptonema sp.]
MKLLKLGLTGLIALVTMLVIGNLQYSQNSNYLITNSAALAQTPVGRKAEADRLLQQGMQESLNSQFQAALKSWQQALSIYREIKDRKGEGDALRNLATTYFQVGDYDKGFEYQQQALTIEREIKKQEDEGNDPTIIPK